MAALAIFIDMLLYGMIIPILPALLMESGVAKEEIESKQTILFASYAAGLFLATPIFGIISDKLNDRKMPMLAGLLALGVSTLGFAYIRDFTLLTISRIFQGISASATWVLGFAMVADAYPSGDGLGFAVGLVLSAHTVGNLAGPLTGGFIGEHFGLQYPFILCASLAGLDLVARLLIRPPKPQPANPMATQNYSIWTLFTNKDVILTLGIVIIVSSSISSIELFMATWLQSEWEYSESQTSLIMVSFILPNIALSPLIGWLSDRMSRIKLLFMGLVVHSLAAPLITKSSSVNWLIFNSILYGASISIASVPLTSHLAYVIELFGCNSYATLYAIFNVFYSVGMMLGPYVVGLVKCKYGFFWGMIVITGTGLLYAPIFLMFSTPYQKRSNFTVVTNKCTDVSIAS